MLKFILFLVISFSLKCLAYSGSEISGTNLSSGQTSLGKDLYSGNNNPAFYSSMKEYGPKYIGVYPSLSLGIEYADISNLWGSLDSASAQFREVEDVIDGTDPSATSLNLSGSHVANINLAAVKSADTEQIQELELISETIINQVSDTALELNDLISDVYAKAQISLNLPILIGPSLGGQWSIQANETYLSKIVSITDPVKALADLQTSLNTLRSEIENTDNSSKEIKTIDFSNNIQMYLNPQTGDLRAELINDSLLLTRVAKTEEISLSYSLPVWQADTGNLHLGFKPRYLEVSLSNAYIRYGELSDAEDIFDDLENAELRSDKGFTADIGAIYQHQYFHLGLTIKNAIEETFNYPDIDNFDEIRSDNIRQRVEQGSKYELETQAQFSFGLYNHNRLLSMSAGLDLNKTSDPMSDEYQWASIGVAYHPDSWLIPAVRLGGKTNLVGTELSYINLGLSFFKVLSIDLASTLEDVKVEDKTLPRGAAASVGLMINF